MLLESIGPAPLQLCGERVEKARMVVAGQPADHLHRRDVPVERGGGEGQHRVDHLRRQRAQSGAGERRRFWPLSLGILAAALLIEVWYDPRYENAPFLWNGTRDLTFYTLGVAAGWMTDRLSFSS